MPELPEVETVRDGLQRWIAGRTVADVEIRHPRSVRRHLAGADDLARRLTGATVVAASRRGKYLWLPLRVGHGDTLSETADEALIAHLGMSGQLLVQPPDAPDEKHLHVRLRFTDGGRELRFVDQRTFGGLVLDELVAVSDLAADPATGAAAEHVPSLVAHIARDPLDPHFDELALVARLRRRRTGIKRALLDQTLISGIGNIYADEALWRARLHGERPTDRLDRARVLALLGDIRAVLTESLSAGGTSFDALYVNVNGSSGYFERSLAVYGREGRACRRCGSRIRREVFMNRSSFSCPRCQRRPSSRPGG